MTKAKKDKVADINLDVTKEAVELQSSIKSGPVETVEGSSFRGHSVEVTKQDDIIPALHAMYADSRVARATHNIYAYRLQTQNGIIEHFDDDREWGAGRLILEALRKSAKVNKLICVSRWCGERKIGKQRFDQVSKQAKCVINLDR